MRLLVFFVAILFLSNPALADCTLSGTAVCNGNSCANETRPEGHVLYNEDFKAHQTCLNNEWIAVGSIGCAAGDGCPSGPTNCSNIGDTCDDGSIYAGLSPDGNAPMYTTPADAPSLIAWNDGTGNWVDTAMVNCTTTTPGAEASCQTGAANTALLVGLNGSGSPAPYQAAEYCDGLSAHGHSDWYLPAQYELDVLYDNKNAGDLNGTFNETGAPTAGYYWSSSESSNASARSQRFSDGNQRNDLKGNVFAVRCVRKGA